MKYGTVVQFFPAKGFGFIRPDAGPDVFFHVTALGACQNQPQIKIGQPVKFDLEPGAVLRRTRRAKPGDAGPADKPPVQPKAVLVELIAKIPGGSLKEASTPRHPRALQRKPNWRR